MAASESKTPWADSIPPNATKAQIESVIRAAQVAAVTAFENDLRHLAEQAIVEASRTVRKDAENLRAHYVYDKLTP
jgi:hypothetical protein